MKLVSKKIRYDLAGKQVYPNWRIDKNISWWNINTFFLGLIWFVITLEFIRDTKAIKGRFYSGKLWLPPRYAKNYFEAVYE